MSQYLYGAISYVKIAQCVRDDSGMCLLLR